MARTRSSSRAPRAVADQLVVLDEVGAARGQLTGGGCRLARREAERRLDDRADEDAVGRLVRRPGQAVRPVDVDEPAPLERAGVAPLAGDDRGDEEAEVGAPVRIRVGQRHPLAVRLDGRPRAARIRRDARGRHAHQRLDRLRRRQLIDDAQHLARNCDRDWRGCPRRGLSPVSAQGDARLWPKRFRRAG